MSEETGPEFQAQCWFMVCKDCGECVESMDVHCDGKMRGQFPVVGDESVPRDEVRIMMGGREVGRAKFDEGGMLRGTLDEGAVHLLGQDLVRGVSIDGGDYSAVSRGYAGYVADCRRADEFNLNEARFRGEVPPGGRIVGMWPEVNR